MDQYRIGWAVESTQGTATAPTEYVPYPASVAICPNYAENFRMVQVPFIGGYRARISRQTQRAEERAMRKRARRYITVSKRAGV